MMMDFSPKASRFEAFAKAFEAHIDEAMETANLEREPRSYLGGSRLGEDCLRMLGYEYHHAPKDEGKEFAGRTLRIFDMGHDGETRMAEYLRSAGFTLLTERPNGGQFGFSVAGDKLRGHIDGVITAGPNDLGLRYPCLWENKALNGKGIKGLYADGLAKTKPVYYVQMETYQAYLGLADNPGLFTALCRETGRIYAELVPFDLAVAQAASDKGVKVVTSREPEELPRVAASSDDYRCKWCSYATRCWSRPETATAAPSWLRPV